MRPDLVDEQTRGRTRENWDVVIGVGEENLWVELGVLAKSVVGCG